LSVLNVENVSHGFGDRTILEDVSFRLLKGEHVGLIGANGEGKSTFLNILPGSQLATLISIPGLPQAKPFARFCGKPLLNYLTWKQRCSLLTKKWLLPTKKK